VEIENRLSVEITEQKSISTVHFSGTYGPLSITLLKEMINALIRNKRYRLILKFNHLADLNEDAYNFLERVHEEVSRQGGAIVLICTPDEPKQICSELEQKRNFLIFQDFEQARDYFIGREF
jgi:anti-anti-sigma regulatory factor